MLDAMKKFLQGNAASGDKRRGTETHDSVQVAACAVLLELAHADGEFSAPERRYIENALARHFGLRDEALQELMRIAEDERRAAVDDFHFTSRIAREYDLGQKMVLAEVMWGVILADGELAPDETYLIRKLANLLDLEPAYLSEAKASARRSR
ncbi:MAG: TerB family tellurite resistance protein [Gemmatimonadales bacterium]